MNEEINRILENDLVAELAKTLEGLDQGTISIEEAMAITKKAKEENNKLRNAIKKLKKKE